MNLVEMRSSFRRRTGGLGGDLSDGEVDFYLNHAYQHSVPDMVPGQLTDGRWLLDTAPTVSEYAFPDWVHSVRPAIYIDSWWLDLHDRDRDFKLRYVDYADTSGRPTAVLNYNRTLTFYPVPDQVYRVDIPARVYPSNAVVGSETERTLAPLAAAGIPYDTHAQAVVWHGVAEFAEDYDLAEIELRAETKAMQKTIELKTRELTRFRRRRPRRTF